MRNSFNTWKGAVRRAWVASFAFALSTVFPVAAGESIGPKHVLLYDYNASNHYNEPRKRLRAALARIAEENGFVLTMTRDQRMVSQVTLARYDVVIFAHGEASSFRAPAAQAGLERYVRDGGGLIALRATGGYVRAFPFLAEAVAVRFAYDQGPIVPGRLYADSQSVRDPGLRWVYAGLPAETVLKERWLSFSNNPRDASGARILFSVGESTKNGNPPGGLPVVWARTLGRGRVIYSGLGSSREAYTQQDGFESKLLRNLIEQASRKEEGEPRKPEKPQATSHLSLEGRRLVLSIGEGLYTLRILDFQGKNVLSGEYRGPGNFQTDPIAVKGAFTAILSGPDVNLRQRITLR